MSGSTFALFDAGGEDAPAVRRIYATSFEPHADKNVCRWCLQLFDPAAQQPRTTQERGALRTHLHMADNGSELVCCDTCWPGAIGMQSFSHGRAVPCADPNEITNPLLR